MSAKFLKICFSVNRLVNQPKVFFSAPCSKFLKPVSYVTDVQSFKTDLMWRATLQRKSEIYGPFRNCCFLSCINSPHEYRTSSLQKLSYQGINGSCKYLYSPVLDAPRGYKTWYSLWQTDKEKKPELTSDEFVKPEEKLSLFKRYQKMLKEYWYVLIPVHVATSLIWFGSFYYAATCGFDIVPFLEKLGVGETIISPFRNSSLGYIAVASALYKLATPARYMVTLGGTTVSINYLTKYGLLKPVPSKAKIKSMIQNKFKQQEKQTKNS